MRSAAPTPDLPPDPGLKGRYSIARHAFESGVTSADAYHAVRQAIREERGVLRLGNRFVREDRYREVGFVALGNASGSMALALVHSLRERVTRGFVAGAEEPPTEVPFRFRTVEPPAFGSPQASEVSAAALELAGELGDHDLLVVLLSAGSLGLLAPGPQHRGGEAWAEWLAALSRGGASPTEVALVMRHLGEGGAGGRLAQAAGKAEVETLVLDRGDGGASIGGGPTIAIAPEERREVRALLERLGTLATLSPGERAILAPDPGMTSGPRAGVHRPVVVARPRDALDGAVSAVADRKWVARVVADRLPDPLPRAANEFLDRVNLAAEQSERVPATGVARGLVLLAGTTLGRVEGADEREGFDEFLRTAMARLLYRNVVVGVARTAGAPADRRGPAGRLVFSTTGGGAVPGFQTMNLPMQSGVTDVGCFALALVPFQGTG